MDKLITDVRRALLCVLCLCFSPAYACLTNAPERLRLRCQLDEVNGKAIEAQDFYNLDYALKRVGYESGLGLKHRLDKFQPIWGAGIGFVKESNINGGNPDKPLVLGNLTFLSDSNRLLKHDYAITPSVNFSGRIIFGVERLIDINVQGSKALGIKTGASISRSSVNICSKNSVGNWLYIDACSTLRTERKALNNQSTQTDELQLERLTSLGSTYYAFAVKLISSSLNNARQLGHAVSVTRMTGEAANSIEIFKADVIDGQHRLTASVLATHQTKFLGSPMALTLSHAKSTGGRLLGTRLEETTRTMQISFEPIKRYRFTLGHTKNQSDISYFSTSHFILEFNYVQQI